MRKSLFKPLLLGAMLLVASIRSQAQEGDTSLLYKEFLLGSQSYQQLPIYLSLHVQGAANFITAPEDTAGADAEFYLLKGGSYIRYGEFEQLVSDSMALLVSTGSERMILYADARPILEAQKASLSGGLSKASLQQLAQNFTVAAVNEGMRKTIRLESRAFLPGTIFPKQTVELQLDVKTGEPVKVFALRRTLIVLSKEDFDRVKELQPADKLLETADHHYFVIKEQTTRYDYKAISHDHTLKVPAAVSDRIVRNKQGVYEPVKEYATYQLSLN